jgi:hypothetical protein
MRRSSFLVLFLLPLCLAAQTAPQQKADPWEHLRVLVGEWRGESEGQPGNGSVTRSYAFVLNGQFLHEKNVSTYPPQEKNPKGEVHEHWTMFSHDRPRKVIVMRQFHTEGFVNQYVLPLDQATKSGFVLESEGFENLPAGWKAREKYEVISADEFVETFELAAPGQPFEVYSRTRFKRARS